MNNKILTIALIVITLFVTALITRNADIAWMTLPFLAYLGTAILQTPASEKLQLNATRSWELKRRDGTPSVEMRLHIQNLSRETVYLVLEEALQAGMVLLAGSNHQAMALEPGGSGDLDYTFTAERGNFSWDFIKIFSSDPLGLIGSELALPAGALVQIHPRIKKFKPIPFRLRDTLHSPGSIPARLGGSGTDFFGVREYHPGDSLRWLDWRLTARHPQTFFTKEFEQEEIAEIGLILDARQRTNIRFGEESMFESSIEATASLAEMFLHQGQRVSLLVFGETILNAYPGYGKHQLQRIMGCLSRAKVGTKNPASLSLDFIPLTMFSTHALIVVISSLSSDDRSLFLRLRAAGYQVLLISPDPLGFAYLALVQDRANQLAMRATRLERRLRLEAIASLQVPVIDWKVDQPLFPLVRNALIRSRGQRL